MTVYFIRRRKDAAGLIKIGHTSDLRKRIENLSVSVPEGFDVLAEIPGGPNVEQYLHEKFADHRVAGEWFKPANDLTALIGKIQAGEAFVLAVNTDRSEPRKPQPQSKSGLFTHYLELTAATPVAEVAFSYLHELVRREHRGKGDTFGASVHRVAAKSGAKPAALKRIWSRWQTMPDVSGNALHALEIALCVVLERDGTITPKFARRLTGYREFLGQNPQFKSDREWAA